MRAYDRMRFVLCECARVCLRVRVGVYVWYVWYVCVCVYAGDECLASEMLSAAACWWPWPP